MISQEEIELQCFNRLAGDGQCRSKNPATMPAMAATWSDRFGALSPCCRIMVELLLSVALAVHSYQLSRCSCYISLCGLYTMDHTLVSVKQRSAPLLVTCFSCESSCCGFSWPGTACVKMVVNKGNLTAPSVSSLVGVHRVI